VTIYDAPDVALAEALAEALAVTLLTGDQRLARWCTGPAWAYVPSGVIFGSWVGRCREESAGVRRGS
jgi:hypothetical protein